MHNKKSDFIIEKLKEVKGKAGFYYKNLVTGEVLAYQENLQLQAASVIKIPVMVEVFNRLNKGNISKSDIFTINKKDKLPSCGVLSYMHDGLQVSLEDLYTLMIILSDNTAANILIKYLGMESINKTMEKLELKQTRLNRLLFDSESAALGIENYISAREIGSLLEKMYKGQLISPEASEEMIGILKNQRLNGKIPFFLHGKVDIAHKTGEDEGITHDVGIVYSPSPFILCICGNEVKVPLFERLIQDISAQLFEMKGV